MLANDYRYYYMTDDEFIRHIRAASDASPIIAELVRRFRIKETPVAPTECPYCKARIEEE